MLGRCIPPEFWKEEKFGLLPESARYVFVGLVFNVGDDGRIYYETSKIAPLLYLDDRVRLIDDLLQLQRNDLIFTNCGDIVIRDWWQFIGIDPSDTTRQRIFARDNYHCIYCGGPPEHLDHIHPKSKGGKDADWNLITACVRCNSSKNDRLIQDWYFSQPFYSEKRANYILEIMESRR